MNHNTINAITPIDGRYLYKIEKLSDYFSEHALFKYRVFVEIKYFLFLSDEVLKNKVYTAYLIIYHVTVLLLNMGYNLRWINILLNLKVYKKIITYN